MIASTDRGRVCLTTNPLTAGTYSWTSTGSPRSVSARCVTSRLSMPISVLLGVSDASLPSYDRYACVRFLRVSALSEAGWPRTSRSSLRCSSSSHRATDADGSYLHVDSGVSGTENQGAPKRLTSHRGTCILHKCC